MQLAAILEVLFPPRCLGCTRRGAVLCDACLDDLPLLPPSACRRCASARWQRGACEGCRQLAPQLHSIRAVCAYQGPARRAVTTLKFRSARYLAPMLGVLMRYELQRRPLHADLVVPVPLASGRLRQRGFNQAELLAREIEPMLGGEVATHVLTRAERPAQHTLRAAERAENLTGAIACAAPAQVSRKSIVLVDDVCTTGATLSACAEALMDAGATRVSGFVFARDL